MTNQDWTELFKGETESEDLLTLIQQVKHRQREEEELDSPILVNCTGCEKRWYTQTNKTFSECCDEPIACDICACRSCGAVLAYVAPIDRCDECGSCDIVKESSGAYPYVDRKTWEKMIEIDEE